MREVELKSVVGDVAAARRMVEAAGGHLDYEGRLIDHRYGDAMGELTRADNVLRLRVYENDAGRKASLDWKGPTRHEGGYKVRDELSTTVGDPDAIATILRALGYRVIIEIERNIAQYTVAGAMVRFEEYPRMDALVEVEGEPDAIEAAILATGLSRHGFSAERLPAFIARFEARTGKRAALSMRELSGIYEYRIDDT